MDRQLMISLAVGTPALVAALTSAWLLQKPSAPGPAQIRSSTATPAALEFCLRAADMLHEVSWAAACYDRREDNDCMLPNAQAARVNALLAREESRCLAIESQAARSSR